MRTIERTIIAKDLKNNVRTIRPKERHDEHTITRNSLKLYSSTMAKRKQNNGKMNYQTDKLSKEKEL